MTHGFTLSPSHPNLLPSSSPSPSSSSHFGPHRHRNLVRHPVHSPSSPSLTSFDSYFDLKRSPHTGLTSPQSPVSGGGLTPRRMGSGSETRTPPVETRERMRGPAFKPPRSSLPLNHSNQTSTSTSSTSGESSLMDSDTSPSSDSLLDYPRETATLGNTNKMGSEGGFFGAATDSSAQRGAGGFFGAASSTSGGPAQGDFFGAPSTSPTEPFFPSASSNAAAQPFFGAPTSLNLPGSNSNTTLRHPSLGSTTSAFADASSLGSASPSLSISSAPPFPRPSSATSFQFTQSPSGNNPAATVNTHDTTSMPDLPLPSNTGPVMDLKLPPSRAVTLPFSNTTSGSASGSTGVSPSASGAATARRFRGVKTVDSDRFQALLPTELVALITAHERATLVLDLRPHTVYSSQAGRILDSFNVCVPSTLLRRANYGLERVADTLPTNEEKMRLLSCRPSSTPAAGGEEVKYVVVMDQDASVLLIDQPVHSMLAKFEREKFRGKLMWLRGGWTAFQHVLRTGGAEVQKVTDMENLMQFDASMMSRTSSSASNSSFSFSSSSSASFPSGNSMVNSFSSSPSGLDQPTLDCRSLPMAAFYQMSTQEHRLADHDQTARSERPPILSASQPQSQSMGRVGSWGSPVKGGTERRVAANPFFDNIRQNQEVGHSLILPQIAAHGIYQQSLSLHTSLAALKTFDVDPVALHPDVLARLPPFLRTLLELEPLKRSEYIARVFTKLNRPNSVGFRICCSGTPTRGRRRRLARRVQWSTAVNRKSIR